MATLFVVLDANILFPLYLRELLLRIASQGTFSPIWSQAILDEATKNLVAKNMMTVEKAAGFESVLKKLYPEAMTEIPTELVAKMTNHPKDRHVLATAVFAGASIIVTNNLRDFQAKDLSCWNITAQSPEKFLIDLYDLHSEEIMQVVTEMAGKLKDLTLKDKPTLGMERLLLLLEKTAAEFSNNIRFHKIKWQISACVSRALTNFGRMQDNKRLLEGDKYRITKSKLDTSIFDKKNDKEILFHQNQHIRSRLTQADVTVFLKLQELLHQILSENRLRP